MRRALSLSALFAALLLSAGPGRAEDDPARTWTIVVAKEQVLLGPGAYDAFCKEHAGRDRRALRTEIVGRLKKLSADAAPRLRKALGSPADTRPLWIVNGLLARLSAAEAEAARKHEAVLWTYPAGAVPEGPPRGKVPDVVPQRRRRKPFSSKGKTIPWHLDALHVPPVWNDLGITGEGVVVASFDFGVHVTHPDIARNLWRNPKEKPNNGRDDDRNGYVDDLYGYDFARLTPDVQDRSRVKHGALTSSCIVGEGVGGTVTGAAPGARLMALLAQGGAWNASRAFEYALENGADVVNMSFSIPGLGDTRGLWRMMAEHACAAGLVMVSGAGNFQREAQVPVQIRIPEGIPSVICVGGLTRDLQVPGFVSLGPVEWAGVRFYGDHPMPEGLVKPDVCAFPGPGIVMIDPSASDGYLDESNKRRGNSLSAPQAAGVVALVLSARPSLNPWEVKAILEATARDLPPAGKDPRTGAGLIDAEAAVRRALGREKPAPVTDR